MNDQKIFTSPRDKYAGQPDHSAAGFWAILNANWQPK